MKGDWNGSGCPYKTLAQKKMREGDDEWDGIDYIDRGINRLSKKTYGNIWAVYGEHKRGKNEW